MGIPSKQIGWSQESNLLHAVSKQLERLTGVIAAHSGGGGGGIPEAPVDGEQYARQNAGWSVVTGGSQDLQSVMDIGSYASKTTDNGNTVTISMQNDSSYGTTILLDSATPDFYNTRITLKNGIFNLWQQVPDGMLTNTTNLAFNTPIANTNIFLPAKAVDGDYTLATLDDIPTPVDTAFVNETYASTMSLAYDEENPNIEIDITGNLDLTITGTVNGDSGLVNLYFSGTQVATLNGVTDLVVTGKSAMIPVWFIHDSDGIKWYNDLTIETLDTRYLPLNSNIYHTIAATTAGTISNVGTAVTGVGTAVTANMVGGKITKSNGETAIIATRSSNTSFTTVAPFATDSVAVAFTVQAKMFTVDNVAGTVAMFSPTGNRRFFMDANGDLFAGALLTAATGNVSAASAPQLDFGTMLIKTAGGVRLTLLKTYASDAAATADGTLAVGYLYLLTGDTAIHIKK